MMEKVKRIRKELGIKQKDMAERLSIVQQTYSNIESGYYSPKNKEKIKDMAIDILYPILMKRILAVREDLERLENMSLQIKPN